MGSGGSKKLPADKAKDVHVVVVGGGYGGMECAVALNKAEVPFTLVDPKSFFHHNVGALRAAVFPEFAANTAIPFAKTFGDRFVQATVVGIDLTARVVSLDTGRDLSFTHLVLATGSTGAFPARTAAADADDLIKEDERCSQEIRKSKKVVIIGGGAVGVELSGELMDMDSSLSVTVLNAGERLLSSANLGQRLQDDAKWLLESRGVVVRTGERVSNLGELTFDKHLSQVVKTEKGNSYEADIVFNCTGLRPNTVLTRKIFGPALFDEHHRLKVTPTLKVEGHENVFAIGDSCNTVEEKMAAHAGSHADLVVENIVRVAQGHEPKTYSSKFTGMVVTVGKSYGVGVINGWHLPSFVWGCVKGRTLFTGQFWAAMDQKMPN